MIRVRSRHCTEAVAIASLNVHEPMSSTLFERITTSVMALAAVAAVGILWSRTSVDAASQAPDADVIVGVDSMWIEQRFDEVVRSALIQDRRDVLTIIEFMDVECPFCARYHSVLTKIKERYGSAMQVGYVHTRISGHANALRGAIGAECALLSGRLDAFLGQVYKSQDEIGWTSWSEFASRAGIKDTLAFGQCMNDTSQRAKVEKSWQLSSSLAIPGTPSVMVGGYRLSSAPGEDALAEIVDKIFSDRPTN